MTATKEKPFRPVVNSLVVIVGTGCSGRVFGKTSEKDNKKVTSDRFSLKLEENLYIGGSEPKVKKGEVIHLQYEPNYEEPERITLHYESGENRSAGDELLVPTENCTWQFAQHPNDGAPVTKEFKFNHWVCWDNGEHQSFEPDWRGGHNYDHKVQPCADVKVHNPGKFLHDREKVEEHIGKLTDVQWKRYKDWIDDAVEDDDDAFNLAVEDARMSLDDCLEGTGLEHGFGGRSGGWFCITNAPTEDEWNAEGLTEEEIERLQSLQRTNHTEGLCEKDHDEMMDLEYRKDEHSGFDGDKAVIRAALHTVEKYAEDEVAYQFTSIMARKFETMLEEEAQDEKEKNERNAGREVVKGFIDYNFVEVTAKEMVAGLQAFDVGAKADGWDWDDKILADGRIETALAEAQMEYDGCKSRAEEQEDEYPVIKPRHMQVVMFNKDGRVGDPIDCMTMKREPEEIEVAKVREWIAKAKESGATGIELQGGFDGAESEEVFKAGNYTPEITSFEVTLWEEK